LLNSTNILFVSLIYTLTITFINNKVVTNSTLEIEHIAVNIQEGESNMKDGKRIKTLMICLVLVLSGLFLIPAIGADDGARSSARYADPDHNDNNFAPNITLNSNPTPPLWNDGMAEVMLVVEISDEDKNETGGALNATGGTTASVTVDLTPLGGSATQAMHDDGLNGDMLAGDDIFTYNVSTTVAAGDYALYFNVTDNGTGSPSGAKWNDTHGMNDTGMWDSPGWNVTITVNQINRPPVADPSTALVKFDEDMYNNTLDLSMYFSDIDGDTITYTKDMMGETNITVDMTNEMAVNISAMANWFGQAMFKITGNDSASIPPQAFTDELTVTVMVASVNDMPMLNASADWAIDEDNVTYVADDTFEGDEGDTWWINVTATDMDVADDLTFDVENSASLPTIFSIGSDGIFEFTPTNDEVGMHTVNVTVTDGIEMDNLEVTFDIGNVNDEPMLTKVWVGTSSVNIVNNAAALTGANAATEDEEFVFMVEGSDEDTGDSLKFTKEDGPDSMVVTQNGDMMANVTYTPTNDDALMGYILVNISMNDGGITKDDYVIINISVTGVNDPPDERPKLKVGEYDNFTIEASDDDMDTLTVTADDTDVTITDIGNDTFEISYNPSAVGNYTVNITVSDGTVEDYYNFMWEVESALPPPPENNDPTIAITTAAGGKVALSGQIVIEGTFSDSDGDEMTIEVEVVQPGGTAFGFYDDLPGTYDSVVYDQAAGTWTYTYDVSQHDLGGILGSISDDFYTGTWTFYFIAVDENGGESAEQSVTVIVEDRDDDDDDAAGFFAALGLMCLLIVLIPLILIIVVIVLLLKKKKAKAAPPPEMPPPAAPMACVACGAEVPPGAPSCPACGAAVEPPAAPMNCAACGAEIPPGAEACPACGAAAPAPAEAPPVETMCECGATIPAGSPTCAACGRPAPAPMPPEGAAPMACPSCGAEIPPGSPACPACGAAPPPPEMPPAEGEYPPAEGEAPPMEGEMPPAEGEAPAEEPPAEDAQMVACPTCGAQIAVGATPCASCGTALNWG
jgi:hypothetical protein